MASSPAGWDATGVVLAGRYRVLRAVARGGFGAVWEAEHLTLHHKVAVKFLLQTGAPESEPSQRFLREARVAASVKHRNVLEIIDFGFTGTDETSAAEAPPGIPYMVMELLVGRTLRERLDVEKRLDAPRAVEIASGILRGLAAVHDAGLVHRDIKPDNVFLVGDEDGEYPKLVDFGLSRRTGRADITAEGVMLGTPLYMAPEQVLRAAVLDARVDLYAVGVLLFQMLAGELPFRGSSIPDTLRRIVIEDPPALGTLVPGISSAIVDAVEKAMSKEPSARFSDARAMRAALIDALPQAAEGERPSGPMPRLRAPTPTSDELEGPIEREAPSENRIAPPRREPWLLVLVRTSVLAVVALVVAALLIDGPWWRWVGDGPTHEAPDAAVRLAMQVDGGADACPVPDATVIDAAVIDDAYAPMDTALEDVGTDAGTDAPLDDAYVPIDTAIEDTNDAAPDIDAAEPPAIEEPIDAAVIAAPVQDAGRVVRHTPPRRPTRRTTHHRTVRRPRRTTRHRPR